MISRYLIDMNATLVQALDALDKVGGIGLIVINDKQELEGVLTDGDLRRSLVKNNNLDGLVKDAMSTNPITATSKTSEAEFLDITRDMRIKVIPIIDNKKVVDVYVAKFDDLKNVPVVIMAGGLGSRLGEITKDCPKPMLEINSKPILEHILENFLKVSFKQFYFAVNYKAHVIKDYFLNGEKFDCHIEYLHEDKRLGTAGPLSLLPKEVTGPVVVMNGDLLTPVDFRRLMTFHKEHDSLVTLCVRNYEFQVPFGVIGIEDEKLSSFDEKPIHKFSVNAGVYVIDAEIIRKFIPVDEYFDMSSLINILIDNDIKSSCYPMVESWIDIGRVDDLKLAKGKYES